MELPNPTFAKILILDTEKFEQWKFRIQQYLRNEYYALWEVIEFCDSYEAPQEVADTGSTSVGSAKKKRRTVAVTAKDMQTRRKDVKARTTLLLALPDEHQLRFSKYKIAQELRERDTGANFQQTAGHSKTSSGKEEINIASFSTASTQVSPASADVAIASFSYDTVCTYIASQSNGSQKKTGKRITIQGTDVACFDKSKVECFNCHKMGHFARECRSYMANEEENNALVADEEAPTKFAPMVKSSFENEVFPHVEARLIEFKNQEIKFCEKIRGLEFKVESKDNRIERLTKELEELKKEKEGLPEFVDDTITDYSRPSPSIESNSSDLQNSDSSVSKKGDSSESIMPKPMIKFVKATDSPTEVKINKVETVRKPSVKYAEMYRNTTKSPKVRGQDGAGDVCRSDGWENRDGV
nr:hypothetical protein [Tanacetum cinerariifolium]